MGAIVPQFPPPRHAREAGVRYRQRKFITAFAAVGRINKAAQLAGVSRWTHQDWIKKDPEFRAEFEHAEALAVQQAEDELYRRGVEGTIVPRTVAGEAVLVKEFSDRCLELFLKARRPERYRERSSVEHSGPGGRPLLDLSAVDEFLRRTENK